MPGWKEAEVRRSQGAASCHPCDAPGISGIQIRVHTAWVMAILFACALTPNFTEEEAQACPEEEEGREEQVNVRGKFDGG